jgi:hypothetical protein
MTEEKGTRLRDLPKETKPPSKLSDAFHLFLLAAMVGGLILLLVLFFRS